MTAGFGRAGLQEQTQSDLSVFLCSSLVGLFESFLLSSFYVLLVHSVASPVLFICPADKKFRYGAWIDWMASCLVSAMCKV